MPPHRRGGGTELAQAIKAVPRGPLQPLVARQLSGLLPADPARLEQLVVAAG